MLRVGLNDGENNAYNGSFGHPLGCTRTLAHNNASLHRLRQLDDYHQRHPLGYVWFAECGIATIFRINSVLERQ